MDFIFRFLRWKAANAVWNEGARAIRRNARNAPPPDARQRQFAGNVGAMLLTLVIVAVLFVALAAVFGGPAPPPAVH